MNARPQADTRIRPGAQKQSKGEGTLASSGSTTTILLSRQMSPSAVALCPVDAHAGLRLVAIRLRHDVVSRANSTSEA